MSAWAQAAWIISQIDNRFDFQETVNEYQQTIATAAVNMQSIYNNFFNKNRVIVAKNQPADTSSLKKGALWLGLKQE